MTVELTRVVAGVIERDGRVLIAQRPHEKRHGGLWEFPGGKVEGGESDFAALSRELLEEFGLLVSCAANSIAELRDAGSEFLIAFVPAVTSGEPVCQEHLAVRWAEWSELLRIPLAPTDAHFVDYFVSRRAHDSSVVRFTTEDHPASLGE